MSIRSLAYGEILWDIIEGEPFLGGAPFNFASHLARFGATSYIISRVGNDDLGKKATTMALQYGVDTRYIQQDATLPTGTVEVILRNGQPDYTIFENVAYDNIQYQEFAEKPDTVSFNVFYFGSLIQRNSASALTLKSILSNYRFQHVFYDVNLRKGGYSKTIIHESLAKCTILKLNIDEVPVVSEMLFDQTQDIKSFAKRISVKYEISVVIITAADKGCFVFHQGILHEVAGIQIDLRDGVGAGDAFSAAFVYSYVNGKDVAEAARIANRIGAFVASRQGPIPDYPDEIIHLVTAS
ncbi:carbohydrate kinase family protein [Parachryseolinea silvisoli]|uniref:carbohydrate kinase family protein n=1 Tax=Parachryseolinea silvisoli TaxID=2873601 RepID=UPI002265925D|nr:carbohydrate kinase [Parachryseolinea silvisoli]MCD9020140.1 carbohydrate kinase [Parachryseolinea silvisoli]